MLQKSDVISELLSQLNNRLQFLNQNLELAIISWSLQGNGLQVVTKYWKIMVQFILLAKEWIVKIAMA